MENQFLRQVAAAYVANDALDSIFVLPNRRSLKFFRMYLGIEYGKVTGKPLFSPQIFTINEFFANLSGLHVADNVMLLYLLYREYIAVRYPKEEFSVAVHKEPFDDFVHWGDMILKDFNDVDKYLVDAGRLFSNVKDLKELENDFSFMSEKQLEAVQSFWRNYLGGGKFSEKKEYFGSIWAIMHTLYLNFNKVLAADGIGYEGSIYRNVAENIKSCNFSKRVVFIGFNAPNNCERTVMQHLKNIGKGDFYWDCSGTYFRDARNGASTIVGECAREYPSMYRIEDSTVPVEEQSIKVYASPSGVGQAFVVADILNSIYPQEKVNPQDAFSTAIVLPDEKLLIPVLNSIPDKFELINVTMGYPIATTSLMSFMKLVQQMQSDVKEINGQWHFYHKSLLDVLSHEYVKKLSPAKAAEVRDMIIAGNVIYLPENSSLLAGADDFMKILLKVARLPKEILEYLMEILRVLDSSLESWDREFIYQYYLKLNTLAQIDLEMEQKTWFRLADRLCNGIMVPFKGEPLAGLQIMGTLETRALDFENVIIISANEGKFPAASAGQSVIPYNLRTGFGLPTYELQDGIAAYHFYRGICRAKNVHIVYDTRSEGLGTGEVSRYVKQLKYHFNIPLQEVAVSVAPLNSGVKEPLKVEKTEEVMQMLSEYLNNGPKSLSASAINNYIACPLKFYMENIEGMKPDEEVAESVESNVFGSIFHYVMEEIYKDRQGKIVAKEDIVAVSHDRENIGKFIREGFLKYMHLNRLEGQHRIVEALIRKYVDLTLKEDAMCAPFRYMAGERKFRYFLPISNGKGKVNFKAFIDRVDILLERNLTRISDYKTGTVSKPDGKFELLDLFDKNGDGKYKAILQLYLYALIYFSGKLDKGETVDDALLVVYPLKKMAREHLMEILLENDSLVEFKRLLVECVEEIFDADVPFYANKNEKHCRYCKLNALCGK